MLGKLMKYEFKATSRLLIPLYLILLIMSVINRFVFMAGEGSEEVFGLITQFLLVTFVLTIIAVAVVTSIYMVVRFYKNLFTDEGYLMFTLPVKSHELIASKLLVNLIWTVASLAAILLALFIAFANAHNLSELSTAFTQTFEGMKNEMGGYGILMIVEFGLLSVVGAVFQALFIYLSISIGQLFGKHKIIGSFAAYMILYTALQFAMMVVIIPLGMLMSNIQPEPSMIPTVFFPIGIVLMVLANAACFFATNYIIKRKLNLE